MLNFVELTLGISRYAVLYLANKNNYKSFPKKKKKKAERRRIDAFELWCWRKLLRAPWTARRSNQSVLKEISPEYSLEGMMLKLELQYFGHLMQRADSLEKTRCWERLRVGGEEGDRG